MSAQNGPKLMTKTEYARHRKVSKPYITKLAQNGVLVMRNGKVDVSATDTVLDDNPVEEVDPPPVQPVTTRSCIGISSVRRVAGPGRLQLRPGADHRNGIPR